MGGGSDTIIFLLLYVTLGFLQVPDKLRIVEMEHERPSFFSKNLMQKNRNIDATTSTVKPTGLV